MSCYFGTKRNKRNAETQVVPGETKESMTLHNRVFIEGPLHSLDVNFRNQENF